MQAYLQVATTEHLGEAAVGTAQIKDEGGGVVLLQERDEEVQQERLSSSYMIMSFRVQLLILSLYAQGKRVSEK